jgi:hypothetical protein
MITIQELRNILIDIRPEMQARLDGLREMWPGKEVLMVLHRNETLMSRIDKAIEK